MKFSIGIVIFLLALIALVAEVILYFIFGIGAAVSGSTESVIGLAAIFVWLMIMTAAAGVTAPIAGLIENVTKKENLGLWIFAGVLLLTGLGSGAFMLLGLGTSFMKAGETSASKRAATWKLEESASQMDGSNTVTLSLTAAEDIQGWLSKSRPVLFIRCKENKTELYVRTEQQAQPGSGSFNEYSVRIRLDEAKPATERWTGSTDGNALFAPNASKVAERLLKAKTMRFEFTPFNASPATSTFNVEGLDQHMPKLKAACPK